MRKILLITVFICTSAAIAQKNDSAEKKFQVNIGGSLLDAKIKNFYVGADYKVSDEMSIGLNYSRSETMYANRYSTEDHNFFQFQTNMDWAKKIGLNTKKFDLYTGFNFAVVSFTQTGSNFNGRLEKDYIDSDISFGGQVGVRYFITKNIGLNFELNAGMLHNNPFRGGITVQF